MDVTDYNRSAWDRQVRENNRWTQPASPEDVQLAREGTLAFGLTCVKPVPAEWWPNLTGTRTLCLAAGGGQQGPLMAAAGAVVTVFDNSPEQLAQDEFVAEREQLQLNTVQGDMKDLSSFADASFDLIVHPCSNCFVPDIRPVWRECARVLTNGGLLLSGFANPVRYLFEDERQENGNLTVKYKIPYSDLEQLTEEEQQEFILGQGHPLEFGHTLSDQIGGQLEAGFVITGFFEDRYYDLQTDPLSNHIETFIATRAMKQHWARNLDSDHR